MATKRKNSGNLSMCSGMGKALKTSLSKGVRSAAGRNLATKCKLGETLFEKRKAKTTNDLLKDYLVKDDFINSVISTEERRSFKKKYDSIDWAKRKVKLTFHEYLAKVAKTKSTTKPGLKADGTLKKGYRYVKGGKIVKVAKK